MDAHRGGYPDEQEGRWFPGDRGYGERYEEERYRVPEPRSGALGPRSGVELPPLPYPPESAPYVPEPYAQEIPRESAFSASSLGTLPQEPPPAAPPPPPPPMSEAQATGGFHPEATGVAGGFHTEAIDRAALRRPPGASGPRSTVYRARRAGLLGALAAVAVVAELLLVRVLLAGEFGHVVAPGAVLGGVFAMTGIPLVAMGLYGLMGGAAAAGASPAPAWLRTPLAYLWIGLVLLVAAGLAVG